MKKFGDLTPRALFFDREVECTTELTKNLKLARHLGLESGGDVKEVCCDVVFEVDRQAIFKLDRRQTC